MSHYIHGICYTVFNFAILNNHAITEFAVIIFGWSVQLRDACGDDS